MENRSQVGGFGSVERRRDRMPSVAARRMSRRRGGCRWVVMALRDDLLRRVLERPEFRDDPPVLVDLGASKEFYPKWEPFAEYAVCVAFEPDDRGRAHLEEGSPYRRLHVRHDVVAAEDSDDRPFYLTKVPGDSSLLEPANEEAAKWGHGDNFQVEDRVTCPTVTVREVLDDLDLDRVDWFKANTQGTDLRLFRSLDPTRRDRVLVAEFQPGIMDAYVDEDKLPAVLAEIDDRELWTARLEVGRGQRIALEDADRWLSRVERSLLSPLSSRSGRSPVSADVTAFSTFPEDRFGRREHLLGWVFATTEGLHGFALSLAADGRERFDDPVFEELLAHSRRRLRSDYLTTVPRLAAEALSKPGRAVSAITNLF